jgi:peptide-methionine (S)-S-oxide reductase
MKRIQLACVLALPLVLLAGCGESAADMRGRASPGVVAERGSNVTSSTAISETGSTMSTPGTTTSASAASSGTPTVVQEAMFGAGCFWGVEMTFAKTPGVLTTAVGYAGGTVDNPTYRQVCNGDTGHAEVVHLTFDPSKVSYQELLAVFFANHDPTQVNRQGPDYGTQYRTVVFAYGDGQKAQAEAAKKMLDSTGKFRRPIATLVEPAPKFWRAEEYHQQYLKKKGLENCHVPGS